MVAQAGRSARVDSVADASAWGGVTAQQTGVRSAVGTPIMVEGRLWGVMAAGSTLEQLLPVDTEARLTSFTELVATAVANAESRAALARLAEEQAALRRVATLVARGVSPEEVFAAVAEEVGQLLPVDSASMCRYESDSTLTFVAQWGGVGTLFPVGSRHPLGGTISARSCSRPVGWPGSTAMPMAPRARSVPASVRRASARRSGRLSPSKGASGV
jgi:GAF domain-containing protein